MALGFGGAPIAAAFTGGFIDGFDRKLGLIMLFEALLVTSSTEDIEPRPPARDENPEPLATAADAVAPT